MGLPTPENPGGLGLPGDRVVLTVSYLFGSKHVEIIGKI